MAVDEGFCNVDATVVVNDNLCNGDEPGSKDENIGMFEKLMVINESVSRVDTPVRDDVNICKVDISILNTQNDKKVDGIMVVHDSVCKLDAYGIKAQENGALKLFNIVVNDK